MKLVTFSPRLKSPLRKRQRTSFSLDTDDIQLPIRESVPWVLPGDVLERILRSKTLSCEDVVNASRACKSMNLGQVRITRILSDKRVSIMRSAMFKYRRVACTLVKKSTTPIHDAVDCGCVDIVEELCLKLSDDDIDKKDVDGITPLMIAAELGADAIVRVLLKYGADVSAVDRDFESALFRASYAGKLNTVKILLENGADVDTRANDDVTALYIAVVEGYYDVVEHLLNNGADPNIPDWEGCTPLTMAIREESDQLALLLLDRGANINVKLMDGCSLLHFAIQIECPLMVRLLLEKGIDFLALDKQGRSALELSNFVGNNEIFELINRFAMERCGHSSWT